MLRLNTSWLMSVLFHHAVPADLYGLLLFLGVDPYWVKYWWNKLLFQPFTVGVKQPLYDAVSQVLWRTAKDDVIDQVCAIFAVISKQRLMDASEICERQN